MAGQRVGLTHAVAPGGEHRRLQASPPLPYGSRRRGSGQKTHEGRGQAFGGQPVAGAGQAREGGGQKREVPSRLPQGRKAVLPAISGYKTVMANHALALSPEGGRNMDCRSGNFEKNVLHLDMMEAAAMAKPSFLLNVILDASGLIGAAVAGDWREAYFEGARIVDRNDAVEIGELSDLVVASAGGFPKDINLYQTSKTIFNAMEAVRPGGALVVLSSCGEGFGDDEVRSMLTEFPDSPAREEELRREFTIAKYVGYTIGFVTENWDFHLVTDMDAAPLEKAGVTVSKNLDEALAKVYARHGHDLSTWLMPHGANTLPKLPK